MAILREEWTLAKRVVTEEGIVTFVKKAPEYLRNRYRILLTDLYYECRGLLLNDYTVTVNGVRVDTKSDAINGSMAARIRCKKYEYDEVAIADQLFREDWPVIDLGAGIGFTTCYLDKLTSTETPVVGIEANPSLDWDIARTKSLNNCNFEVVQAAYGPGQNMIEFFVSEEFWSSSRYNRMDNEQNIVEVEATSLEAVIADFELTAPIQVVADIEGAEEQLLTEEIDILSQFVAFLIIEFHSFAEHDIPFYEKILNEYGFELAIKKKNVAGYSNTELIDTSI